MSFQTSYYVFGTFKTLFCTFYDVFIIQEFDRGGNSHLESLSNLTARSKLWSRGLS